MNKETGFGQINEINKKVEIDFSINELIWNSQYDDEYEYHRERLISLLPSAANLDLYDTNTLQALQSQYTLSEAEEKIYKDYAAAAKKVKEANANSLRHNWNESKRETV